MGTTVSPPSKVARARHKRSKDLVKADSAVKEGPDAKYRQTIANLESALSHQKSLNQSLQESIENLLLLQRLSEIIGRSKSLKDILEGFISTARRTVSFLSAAVYLAEKKENNWILKYDLVLDESHRKVIQQHMEEGVIEWAMLQNRPVSVPDLSRVKKERSQWMGGFIIIPMFSGDKRMGFAEIQLENLRKINSFTHLSMLDFLARQAAIAIDNHLLYNELRESHELYRQSETLIIQAEKMAAIGIMASGVAHEINNPLQIILSQAQVLLRKVKEERAIEGLKIIEKETQRMGRIVGSLLRYSKQKSAAGPVKIEPIIEDVMTLVNNRLIQRQLEVKKELSPDTPEIVVNPAEIQQVFLNLIENAAHATSPGGHLYVRTRAEEADLVIEVEDTGCGIPKENLSRIFVPFFTTKGPDKGTGLGLFLCHDIVKRYNGAIHVESEVGKGTLFSIRFPAMNNPASLPS